MYMQEQVREKINQILENVTNVTKIKYNFEKNDDCNERGGKVLLIPNVKIFF